MEFLNKVHRTHDQHKVEHTDIIGSVANMMASQNRMPYLEEMAGQGIAIEFFRDTADGKLKATNVKTKVTTIIDEKVLPQNVVTILNAYFAENKDPVDVLIGTNGQILRINPEVAPDNESMNQLKAAISKSNLWRVKNDPVNNQTQAVTPPAGQQQISEAVDDNSLDKFSDMLCDILLEYKNNPAEEIIDAFEMAIDNFAEESDDGIDESKYNKAYAEGLKLLKSIVSKLK